MEENEMIQLKAAAYGTVSNLLNNAICYMYEQGLSTTEIATCLGVDNEAIDAVIDDDVRYLADPN